MSAGYTLQVGGHPLAAWVTDDEGRELLRIQADLQDARARRAVVRRIAQLTGKAPERVAAALALLAARVAPLSFWEMEAALGQDLLKPGESYYKAPGPKHHVPNTVYTARKLYRVRDNSPRPALWAAAKEFFPLPSGVKPWTRGVVLYSNQREHAVVCDMLSNSWRNPANAQHKRRMLYYNILPRINGTQVYQLQVPVDDWTPKVHQSLAKRINRAIKKGEDEGAGWMWVNNGARRGYYLYLTSVPGLAGFEPVQDVEATLVEALKGIHPPERDDEGGRFRPYGGSDNWVARVDTTGEEDKGQWEIIAKRQGPADFVAVEAECITGAVQCEAVPPYWRAQVGPGLQLKIGWSEAVSLFTDLGYALTRRAARAAAGGWAD